MLKKSESNITYIDGKPYAVCLPHGGTNKNTEESEFSMLLRGAGDRNMNCQMGSWCSNKFVGTLFNEEEGFYWNVAGYVTQHDGKPENWDVYRPGGACYSLGFRPVLVPLDKDSLEPDLTIFGNLPNGSLVQLGTLYMNDIPLQKPLNPIASPMPKDFSHPERGCYPGDVPVYKRGASLRIGDTSDLDCEKIPFVVVDGKLISDRVLLGCVSHDDLEAQFHLSKDVTLVQAHKQNEPPKNAEGPIPLWMRLGVSIEVTPDELEALRAEGGSAQEMLIKLLCSGRCRIDGDTYFPEDQPVLEDELNFDLPYMTFAAQSPVKERGVGGEKSSLSEQIQNAENKQGPGQSPPGPGAGKGNKPIR